MGFSEHDDRPAPESGQAKTSLQEAALQEAARKSRLAQALRANLNRRKAQTRARAAGQSGPGAERPTETVGRRD
ncbi:hypothetical protein SAMN05444581_11642 [Methylocapsa palsarum]|uniref:Uncharacterized protein n=1 Tax=Methylocapsa palsarum TaxID=1612308 RepID=A0A1I4BRS9_9HYPH|nr:hypothetical protein SAMN05444581_11642 [Methylocapsa palsarum]